MIHHPVLLISSEYAEVAVARWMMIHELQCIRITVIATVVVSVKAGQPDLAKSITSF